MLNGPDGREGHDRCGDAKLEAVSDQPEWSDDVDQADWIAGRIAPFGEGVVSVVPAGFEAYARISDPAWLYREDGEIERGVRWLEIAAWSGAIIAPISQFYSISTPQEVVADDPPYSDQPRKGSLDQKDAEAIIPISCVIGRLRPITVGSVCGTGMAGTVGVSLNSLPKRQWRCEIR